MGAGIRPEFVDPAGPRMFDSPAKRGHQSEMSKAAERPRAGAEARVSSSEDGMRPAFFAVIANRGSVLMFLVADRAANHPPIALLQRPEIVAEDAPERRELRARQL